MITRFGRCGAVHGGRVRYSNINERRRRARVISVDEKGVALCWTLSGCPLLLTHRDLDVLAVWEE